MTKILVLSASSPNFGRPLDTALETNRIQRVMPQSWEVRHIPHVKTDQLQDEIEEFQPDILQISSHSALDGSIWIFGEHDRLLEVGYDYFGRAIIDACEKPISLFLLNACNTIPLANVLLPHADAVIAVDNDITDDAAALFPAKLYQYLRKPDCSLARAFKRTQTFINLEHPGRGDSYVLLAGRGKDHASLGDLRYMDAGEPAVELPDIDDHPGLLRYYDPYAIKARKDQHDEQLMYESIRWWAKKKRLAQPPLPLLCRKEHVDNQKFWPGWDLAIVLLQGGLTFQQSDAENCLSVDLTDTRWGIYSNPGKSFLQHTFLTAEEERQKLRADAQEFHQDQIKHVPTSVSWPFQHPKHVLRWASGGYLPIVRYKDRRWLVLFFRDIEPIGWNIANGASENQLERLRPDLLSLREATEELVVLERRPRRGQRVRSMRLDFGAHFDGRDAERLLEIHDEERREHDQVEIVRGPDVKALKVERIAGPTEICVTDQGHEPTRTGGYFVSINPLALGIEATSIGEFELPEHAYIIDGETLMDTNPESFEVSHQLIRRPVGLFAVDYFKRVFREENGLGTSNWGEGRVLSEVSSDDFIIFDYDIEQRKLLHQRRGDYGQETQWLRRWEEPFRRACEDGVLEGELLTLCPVTWRTLEIALSKITTED